LKSRVQTVGVAAPGPDTQRLHEIAISHDGGPPIAHCG
jgi:hypothetical protein